MPAFPSVGDQFGDYLVEAVLGRGGMGVVFRAQHTRLGRVVALKVLAPDATVDQEARQRFTREASILAAMDSPHIIQIYEYGEHDGCLFIATQLVTGGDLAERLRSRGPLTTEAALQVADQLTIALGDAHAAGVVHRDVKASNVLMREDAHLRHAYLCDFGIARGDREGLTQTGAVIGTYGYLAPERCLGDQASPASDVYSLGCLLVAMLTGAPPYAGSDLQVMQAHLEAPVPRWASPEGENDALNRVVARSMAKRPDDRYPSMAAFRADLRTVPVTPGVIALPLADPDQTALRLSPSPATQLRSGPRVQRPGSGTPEHTDPLPAPVRRSRRPLAAAAAGAAVIAVVTVLALPLLRGSDPSAPAGATTPRSTGSPTGAPIAEATRTCWNGTRPGTDQTCPLPTGVAGMRFLYPSYAAAEKDGRCKAAVFYPKSGMTRSRECRYSSPDGRYVRVDYSEWLTWAQAERHYVEKYDGRAVAGSGRFKGQIDFRYCTGCGERATVQSALLYDEPIRYSVAVVAFTQQGLEYGRTLVTRPRPAAGLVR